MQTKEGEEGTLCNSFLLEFLDKFQIVSERYSQGCIKV